MMDNINDLPARILYQAIMEIKEPVIFKGILQDTTGEYAWKLFDWNLSEIIEKFGTIKLPFRIGYNARSMNPQWDTNCAVVKMTLSEFIQNLKLDESKRKWYYFDYKYMHEWFRNESEILNSVNWKRFGINKNGEDSTLWIGSKGAHTNCHQDSYGCNIVAQIIGRKQWLLFPPSSSNFLQPTRVPYEESTIYSKYNFFCPTKEAEINILKGQEKPRLITLEAGDVLFVPPEWWHYVESLDFTISVNMWLPIVTDNIARVKEAIVKLIVARIGKNICSASDEHHCTLPYCLNLLNVALKECKNVETPESQCKRMKQDPWTAIDLATKYPDHVKLLRELNVLELEEFLKMKRERFSEDCNEFPIDDSCTVNPEIQNRTSFDQQLSENIVNAFCHPDVINKVAELLL